MKYLGNNSHDESIATIADIKNYKNAVLVDSYGAVGDGTTDDTQAIKAAIVAAGVGGTILMNNKKTYLVTETLELLDGQTFDGNGATILWQGESSDGDVRHAPPIMRATGSFESEIDILESPVSVGYPSGKESGKNNERGFTTIKLGSNPGYKHGDRIIIQAIRNAMSEESGIYWAGTTTANTVPGWWAEPLIVNDVLHETGSNVWVVQCVGSLTYPYYLTEPEDGVDISTETEPVYVDEDGYRIATSTIGSTLVGYQLVPNGASHIRRNCSTVRKVNFLNDICIKNIKVLANGITHSGDRGENPEGWVATAEGNTILISLCEGALIENVHIIKTDAGRGLRMDNCLNSVWKNCSIENDYRLFDANETHVYGNFFTFESCWYCTADGCTSIKSGQSFDTGYAGIIRCPSIYITVRDCTVLQSIDNAATNHSGNWGMSFENCRFVGCAAPLLIRSPMTTVRGCSFSGSWGGSPVDANYPGNYDPACDNWNIALAEPTLFGCVVENCTFSGGKGVRVAPYQIRYFNFNEGNYLNSGSYVEVGDKVTGGNPFPPSKKALNIRISNNVFNGTQGALFIKTVDRWYKNSSGRLTDYAKMDMCVDFNGNTLTGVGTNYQPIILDNFVNGVQLRENRFVRCISHVAYDSITGEQTEWPYYIKKENIWKPVDLQYLIKTGSDNVRITIEDNTISECGGSYLYLYNTVSIVRTDMDTNGVAEFITRNNRIDKRLVGGTNMSIAQTDADVERSFVNVGKTVAERTVESVHVGSTMGLGAGLRYNLSSNDVAISMLTHGKERFRVQHDAAYSPNKVAKVPGCLLRTWTGSSVGTYTITFRLAVYEPIEQVIGNNTVIIPVTQDMYERVSACWDAGEDEDGNQVTFSSPVVLVTTDIDDDGNVNVTKMTISAPLNAALEYTTIDQRRSVNQNTGKVTVSGTGTCTCFSLIPSGYSPSIGDHVTVFSEMFENTSTDSNTLRVDSISNITPSIFDQSIYDVTVPPAPIIDEPGIITMYELFYNPPEQMDLGTEEYPWKTIYTDNLCVGGNLIVNVESFGAIGNGVTDDTVSIQAAFNSGASKIIFKNGKTYKLTSSITCNRDVEVYFNGASFNMAYGVMFQFSGTPVETITGTSYIRDQVEYCPTITSAYVLTSSGGVPTSLSLVDGGQALTPESDAYYRILTNDEFLNKIYIWNGNSYEEYTGTDYGFDYSGLAFLTGTNRFDLHRTFYYSGFPTSFDKGEIVIPYPIDVENPTIIKYNPVHVKLHDLGNVTFTNIYNTTHNMAIRIVYGYQCEITNFDTTAKYAYDVIELDRCLYTTIRNCCIHESTQHASGNTYLIGAVSSCYTYIKNCDLYNKFWHCITTGGSDLGHTLCYHTEIDGCSCVSEVQPAIADHPNGRNTIITDSSVTSMHVGPLSVIDRVEVYPKEASTMRQAHITLVGDSDPDNAVYHISNVKFHTAYETTANGIRVQLDDDPNTGIQPDDGIRHFYLTALYIDNVYGDTRPCLYIKSTGGRFTTNEQSTSFGHVGDIYLSNCVISRASLRSEDKAFTDITKFTLYLNSTDIRMAGCYNNIVSNGASAVSTISAYDDFGNSKTFVYGDLRGSGLQVSSINALLSYIREGKIISMGTMLQPIRSESGDITGWQTTRYNVNKAGNTSTAYYQYWLNGSMTTGSFVCAINAYIVGETPLAIDWLSLSEGGEAVLPEEGQLYKVITDGEYKDKIYVWTGSFYNQYTN